jgi:hypothetical protein
MHVLINNKTLKVLKLHESVEALICFADLLAPDDDYRICDTYPESYEVYTDLELRWIYYNTMGVVTPASKDGTFTRAHLIREVEDCIDSQVIDETPIATLIAKLEAKNI